MRHLEEVNQVFPYFFYFSFNFNAKVSTDIQKHTQTMCMQEYLLTSNNLSSLYDFYNQTLVYVYMLIYQASPIIVASVPHGVGFFWISNDHMVS